jgi:hypothetical protein
MAWRHADFDYLHSSAYFAAHIYLRFKSHNAWLARDRGIVPPKSMLGEVLGALDQPGAERGVAASGAHIASARIARRTERRTGRRLFHGERVS